MSAWVKRAVLSFSSFLRCLTRLPSCTVDQITSGLNSRISKASCQCIQTRIAAVPSSVSKATREAAEGFPTNLSRVSRSVTRWALIDPPPRVSYSPRGDMPEALDQTQADAVDDVLGQPREQLRLEHVEHQRRPRNRRVAASIRPM